MLFFRRLAIGMIAGSLLSSAAMAQHKRTYNPDFKIRGHAPEWVEVESDVGSIFSIDIKSIQHPFGTDPNARTRLNGGEHEPAREWVDVVDVVILGPDSDLREYRFNCHGRVTTFLPLISLNIPPRSVMGEIERIACKDKIY